MRRHTQLIVSLCLLLASCSRHETPERAIRITDAPHPHACADLDGSVPTSHGTFSGDPDAIWLTEKTPDRRMCLTENFSFTDPKNTKWLTPANYRVDGASIPRALWSAVGSPYTGDYRRASIVHDKACDDAHGNKVARRAADRMFFHACRAGGCNIRQATILYLGVRIGAWRGLVPAWEPSLASDERGPDVETTPTDQRLLGDFQRIAKIVLSQPETDDPEELEKRTDSAASAIVGKDMREQ